MIFVTPVGPYFKGGFSTNPYVIIRDYDRAAPLGTGIYKVGGNYAASLKANDIAHKKGYASEFYLDSMAIQPGHRGLSIGKKLMTYAIEKGKALGCKNATLLVDTHKPRLEAYYRSLGFEVFAQMEYFGHIYNRMGLPNTEC